MGGCTLVSSGGCVPISPRGVKVDEDGSGELGYEEMKVMVRSMKAPHPTGPSHVP